MVTLKEAAQAYEPPQTLNIADLEKVPVDIEITEEEHERKNPKEGEEKSFKVNIVMINDKKYRVPNSVLEKMKGILERLPKTKYVSVLKSGTGMNTSYQVLPMDPPV